MISSKVNLFSVNLSPDPIPYRRKATEPGALTFPCPVYPFVHFSGMVFQEIPHKSEEKPNQFRNFHKFAGLVDFFM